MCEQTDSGSDVCSKNSVRRTEEANEHGYLEQRSLDGEEGEGGKRMVSRASRCMVEDMKKSSHQRRFRFNILRKISVRRRRSRRMEEKVETGKACHSKLRSKAWRRCKIK